MNKYSLEIDIDSLVEKYEVDELTGCWNWIGFVNKRGYGVYSKTFAGKRYYLYAHRLFYGKIEGDLQEELVIDHKCRNKRCVNPKHLRMVDTRTNVLENSESVQAKNIVKTHCDYGHEFTPENTYKNHKGRGCLACRKNYYQKDKVKWKETSKLNYENNKEARKAYGKEYRKNNAEKIKVLNRKWYEKNKEKFNENNRNKRKLARSSGLSEQP